MPTEAQIEELREWLRDPENEIGPGAPAAVHRQQVEDIWHEALHISGDDIPEALRIAVIATDTDAAPGETRDRRGSDAHLLYVYRQDGIPSRAFSAVGEYVGVDKVKHFFRCAELAYQTHFESGVRFAGKAYEAWNWVAGLDDGTGVYDEGDIWADNLGAAFGMMLVENPEQSIYQFLQSPNQDVLVVEGVSVYEGDYIREIVIPSPRLMETGKSMELRMIDEDGNPYVIVVEGDVNGIRYLRANSSNYYVAKNDPWYRPAPERGRLDLRPGHASHADRAVRRDIKTKEGIAQRLARNITQNRARQDRMREEMGSNPIMSQRVNYDALSDWIRQDQERQQRIQEDLVRLDAQLRALRAPHSVEPVHNTIHQHPPHNPIDSQPVFQPNDNPIHRQQSHHEAIAAQSRAETMHRQAEARAEEQRRHDEQHQQQHQRQQQRDQLHNQHNGQLQEQIRRHNEHQKQQDDLHKQNQEMHEQQRKLNDKNLFS